MSNAKKIIILLSGVPIFFVFILAISTIISLEESYIPVILFLVAIPILVFTPTIIARLVGENLTVHMWFPVAGDPEFKHKAVAIGLLLLFFLPWLTLKLISLI